MFFNRFWNRSSWVPNPDRKLIVYVGWPLKAPKEWHRAKRYDRDAIELENGESVRPSTVNSRLVVYSNGEIMNAVDVFFPLPQGVEFLETGESPKIALTLNSLEEELGKRTCEVRNSSPRKDSEGNTTYATSICNISEKRIRIDQFAAFIRARGHYVLHTASGGFYSADQFIAWYAVSANGWISPGEKVTDENNYGHGNGVWVFFGQTEDGSRFVAAVELPR